MDTVAVSLGGSFLVKEDGVDVELTRKVAELLTKLASDQTRILAVVGGGAIARNYIRGARALGADETSLDELGIGVTRINARVLLAALPRAHAYPQPALSFHEAIDASRSFNIVVMGGTHPGHTTDAVAVMLGDRVRARRVVIATNVDGVYTADPKKDRTATLLPRLSPETLVKIVAGGDARAGGVGVIDELGAKIIARSRLECAVVNGRDLRALEAAISGATDFHGSLITPAADEQSHLVSLDSLLAQSGVGDLTLMEGLLKYLARNPGTDSTPEILERETDVSRKERAHALLNILKYAPSPGHPPKHLSREEVQDALQRVHDYRTRAERSERAQRKRKAGIQESGEEE